MSESYYSRWKKTYITQPHEQGCVMEFIVECCMRLGWADRHFDLWERECGWSDE